MKYFLALLFVAFVSAVEAQYQNPTSQSINKFGLDAYTQLSTESDFLISPLSISSAMAMTYLGASGQTKTQIEEVFYFKDDARFLKGFSNLYNQFEKDDPETTIAVANKLWPGSIKLNDVFKAENIYYFNSPIETIDYGSPVEASNTINTWVAEQTNNKITELIDPAQLPADIVLFLVNAVYFKSGWTEEFDPKKTTKGRFRNDVNESIDVDYMHAKGSFNVQENREVDVLELQYSNGSFSFMILCQKLP